VRPVRSKAFVRSVSPAVKVNELRHLSQWIKRAYHLLLIALDGLAYVTSAARNVKARYSCKPLPRSIAAVQDPLPVARRSVFGLSHDPAQFSPPLEYKILRAMEVHQSLRRGRYLVRFGFLQGLIESFGQ
jgi:hypothetical protein